VSSPRPYVEEAFGILTDDDLYLDCILVKPAVTPDTALQALRVWVPRYPLTKGSVLTCARQEVQAAGQEGRTAHLVFDLRGTGESEGQPGDRRFDLDLEAIRLWAGERFGAIGLAFLGRPYGQEQVDVRPIRPGVVMETYHYPASQARPPVFYLATYGHFAESDEALCLALAEAGHEVFAIDPLRYLLHASAAEPLSVATLWADATAFVADLPGAPLVVGQPVAAGLGLLWTAGVDDIAGVVAIGHAQVAFKPAHIFANSNPHTFFLGRYVDRIAPRGAAFVKLTGHRLGGDDEEMAALYHTCAEPRRAVQTKALTPTLLLDLLNWLTDAG
jgi:hypothetical protein